MRFKTDIEALILATLENGPKHGYAIVKTLRTQSDGLFKLNEGQLYPLLHSMQEKGLIRGEWETSETGPARKIYIILEAGNAELESRRSDWNEFAASVKRSLFPVQITQKGEARG